VKVFHFFDIGGIADHHYLNFFSQLNVFEKGKGQLYEDERKTNNFLHKLVVVGCI